MTYTRKTPPLVNKRGALTRYGLACGYVETFPGGICMRMPSPSAGVVLVQGVTGADVIYNGRSVTAARRAAFQASRPFVSRDRYWLRVGADTLEDKSTRAFDSLKAAREMFADVARELERFGQTLEASVHIAPTRDALADYPDYLLSVGPRGGIVTVRA